MDDDSVDLWLSASASWFFLFQMILSSLLIHLPFRKISDPFPFPMHSKEKARQHRRATGDVIRTICLVCRACKHIRQGARQARMEYKGYLVSLRMRTGFMQMPELKLIKKADRS